MKTYLFPLVFAALSFASTSLNAQGLLSLTQRNADYSENIPLTFNLSVGGGYDYTEYSTPGSENVESYFAQAGVGLIYAQTGKTTQWNIGVDLGATRYFEDDQRGDDLYYNTRLALNFAHQFTRRLTFSNNLYFTYEIEPDYDIGFTSGRRNGQYIYAHENASVAYAWTERLATTTGYTAQMIHYVDDDLTGQFEDRLTQIFSQQISYKISRKTSLTLEYRYSMTNYEDADEDNIAGVGNPDYTSHYLLVGVDQAWSDRLSASVRVGAELYQSDRQDKTSPYLEGSLSYQLAKRTNLNWYAQVGSDGSELGLYDARYSYRTGLNLSHQFTERFRGFTGVNYAYSTFEGNELVGDSNENQINASLGFSYNFWSNLSLEGSYSYTTIISDTEAREFQRHRVDLGLNATF